MVEDCGGVAPMALRGAKGVRRMTSSLRPPTAWLPIWKRRLFLSSIATIAWRSWSSSLSGTDWCVRVKGLQPTTACD